MKKIIVLLAAIMLLSGCSMTETTKNDEQVNSAAVETETADAEKNTKKDAKNDILSQDEVCEQTVGIYASVEYIDSFRQTKSAVKASDDFAYVYLHKSQSGQYAAGISDGHQGSPELYVVDFEVNDSGEYNTYYASAPDKMALKVTYLPNKESLQIENTGELVFWKAQERNLEFVDAEDIESELAKILFDGFKDVGVRDDGVYTVIDGKEKKITVCTDIVVTSPFSIDGYDGFMRMESDDESIFCRYTYSQNSITIETDATEYSTNTDDIVGETYTFTK